MMMTDYDNDNSHDPDEHVWCLERTARPLPASRSLPAAIRRLLGQLSPSTACNDNDDSDHNDNNDDSQWR